MALIEIKMGAHNTSDSDSELGRASALKRKDEAFAIIQDLHTF